MNLMIKPSKILLGKSGNLMITFPYGLPWNQVTWRFNLYSVGFYLVWSTENRARS